MEKNRKATRQSYGEALRDLGYENERIIVMDADLSGATMTRLFRDEFPERFVNFGIAESNMVSSAAGCSTMGFVPFVSTFAMFAAGRAFEQIRNSVAYPKLNVKIAATHAGISVGEDGATHQCIEDIALMRSIPGMVVLSPADETETKAAIRAAADYFGPVYIRLGRLAVDSIYDEENYEFEIGKGHTLRSGKDVALIATGLEVGEALKAAELLHYRGIEAEVIDISTIKPLDTEIILKAAHKCRRLVTLEEGTIIGGLGAAVCELVSEINPVPVLRIGVEDRFGESGKGAELIEKFGLNASSIARKTEAFIKRDILAEPAAHLHEIQPMLLQDKYSQ